MTTPIPLHCNICPKQPDFSDVSHLLTHIASKGHLSHYYKVKVRSSTELDAAKLVDEYDKWYTEWNVEDLMSERMNLKDKKRPRTRLSAPSTRAKTRRATPASHAPSSRSFSSAPPARPSSFALSSVNKLDPRLSDHAIKQERSASPYIDPSSLFHAHIPRMVQWPASYQSPTPMKSHLSTESSVSSEFGDNAFFKKSHVPCGQDGTDDTVVSESNKLKGILWPGMDIFDSATPEMRRKRNQKKDTSVIEQLEQNSLEVDPSELVFSPSGSFQRQRRISRLLEEESSPIKASPVKQRIRRNVLADLDANNGLPRLRSHSRNPSYFPDNEQAILDDEDEDMEFQLTYGPPPGSRKKKRQAFDIFEDKTEEQASFARPAPMNYLTAEFRHAESKTYGFPQPTYNQPNYHAAFGMVNNVEYDIKPTGNDLFHFDEKENFDLAQYQCGFDFGTVAPPTTTPTYNFNVGDFAAPAKFPGFFTNPLIFTNCKSTTEGGDEDDGRTISAPPSEI